jgi:chitodextrinase
LPGASATSIPVTGLAPGTSYQFSLVARDADGNASAPLSVDVTTAPPPVSLPTNLTPAPSKITPAPVNTEALAGATASLSAATVSAYLAKLGVSCNGGAGTSCDLVIKLALIETLKGGTVVAITARSKPKPVRRTVTLGTTTVTVAGGSHKTVSVKLNSAARGLLRQYHHLRVALTATDSTSHSVLVNRVLTFRQP